MAKVSILRDGSIIFLCPGCGHYHSIKPGVWDWNGDIERPTFSPSLRVQSTDPEGKLITICHLYVTDGRLQFLSDSPHKLRGKSVEMLEADNDI